MRNAVEVASFGGEVKETVDAARGHRKDDEYDDVDERNSSLRTKLQKAINIIRLITR